MKITEILVESRDLEEGPMLNKFGSAVGKFAGGVAKGVGAVAGGVAGAGTAMKKGWDAGKAVVARAGDDEPETAADGPTVQPSATDINKDGPAGTAQAKPLQGQAKVAADKTAAATADQDPATAGQTMYSQVKANINKLDKKGKQRILQLLQKSMAAPEPQAAAPQAGAGAMGQMANQLTKPAASKPAARVKPAFGGDSKPAAEPQAAPPAAGQPDELGRVEPTMAAEPTTAPKKTAEPTAAPAAVTPPKKTGGRVKGQLSQDPRAVKRREANAAKTKQAAPAQSQAEIDADRERIMGVTSDSIVRRQPMMAEGFSLFRKRT
jgi:hypothetical protein